MMSWPLTQPKTRVSKDAREKKVRSIQTYWLVFEMGDKALCDMHERGVCIILIYIGKESASLAVESEVDLMTVASSIICPQMADIRAQSSFAVDVTASLRARSGDLLDMPGRNLGSNFVCYL